MAVINEVTDQRRANCSKTTGELLASVVDSWGLRMLASKNYNFASIFCGASCSIDVELRVKKHCANAGL